VHQNLVTIEDKIHNKYKQARTDIINFVSMSKNDFTSNQLQNLYKDVKKKKLGLSEIGT
jgi:hypothetical protein